MKIAVILSTYNGSKYFIEQLDSIINQETIYSYDIFIRDDGSSDITKSQIKKYSHKNNIFVSYGKNLGVNKSFHSLLKKVKLYDLIYFSDQDDVWHPSKLNVIAQFYENLKTSTPTLLFTNAIYVYNSSKNSTNLVQSNDVNYSLVNILLGNSIMGCSFAINKKLINQVIGKVCNDYMLYDQTILSIASIIGKIYFINKPLLFYRVHDSNLTISKNPIKKLKIKLHKISNKYYYVHFKISFLMKFYNLSKFLDSLNYLLIFKLLNYKNSIFVRLSLVFNKNIIPCNPKWKMRTRIKILLGLL